MPSRQELLVERANLQEEYDYYYWNEKYEKCHEIQLKIDEIDQMLEGDN